MIIFWLVMLVALVVVEAVTYALVSIWFALGALVALIAATLNAQLWLQITLFIVVSAAAVAATRPLVKRYAGKKVTRTNADKVLDMTGIVKERIDNISGTGAVYVDGKHWTARSADGAIIEVEERVKIQKIEGVKLFVEAEAKPLETVVSASEKRD